MGNQLKQLLTNDGINCCHDGHPLIKSAKCMQQLLILQTINKGTATKKTKKKIGNALCARNDNTNLTANFVLSKLHQLQALSQFI